MHLVQNPNIFFQSCVFAIFVCDGKKKWLQKIRLAGTVVYAARQAFVECATTVDQKMAMNHEFCELSIS